MPPDDDVFASDVRIEAIRARALSAGRTVTVIVVASRSAGVSPDPAACPDAPWAPDDPPPDNGARGGVGVADAEALGGCRPSSPIPSAKAVSALTARNPDERAAPTRVDGRLSATSPMPARPMNALFRR